MTGAPRSLTILGATGSIGRSTIAVIEEMRERGHALQVEAVTGGDNLDRLVEVARALRPRFVAISDPMRLAEARAGMAQAGVEVEVGAGRSALVDAAARPAEWVMSAITGAAALAPTRAAIERGATVALANKECLVCAGPLIMAAARLHNAQLLPVDSEHNAIFQVWQTPDRIERVTLTASGGPFRTWTRAKMAAADPAAACKHPNWSMGAKISVDSATLMNKGLELIEAGYLFDIAEPKIDVLIHPQSIIHSLVAFCDGSVLAQMAAPDMRVPIAHALAWPDRAAISARRLNLAEIGALTFEAPDPVRFPALALARAAYSAGGGTPAALNAANETAVEAFLGGRIGFLAIADVVAHVLDAYEGNRLGAVAKSPSSFDEVTALDGAARSVAAAYIARTAT